MQFEMHTVEPVHHRLVLTNRLEDLTLLSEWLTELFGSLQLSSRAAFRLELVLSEAVTNIIDYAYADESEHKIQVTLSALDRTLTIELRDDGLPFDPLQQPEVQLPTCLEDASEGGLGIHLIRSYIDASHYHRDGDQNVLTLHIHDLD